MRGHAAKQQPSASSVRWSICRVETDCVLVGFGDTGCDESKNEHAKVGGYKPEPIGFVDDDKGEARVSMHWTKATRVQD